MGVHETDEFGFPRLSKTDSSLILEIASPSNVSPNSAFVFTMYKRVDKKVKPVPSNFPEECYVHCCIPEDPLLTLPPLPLHSPKFTFTVKISNERMETLNINHEGFLMPEEEKLSKYIMVLNEEAIAFEDSE